MKYNNDEELLKAYKDWIAKQPNQREGKLRKPDGYITPIRRIADYFQIELISLTVEKYDEIYDIISNWPTDGSIVLSGNDKLSNRKIDSNSKSDFKTNWKDFGNFLKSNKQISDKSVFDSPTHSTSAQGNCRNLIVYGIPGCGKSYYLEEEYLKKGGFGEIIRTTFYPDYSNTDFIGQLRPTKDEDGLKYSVVPGPFTRALEKALEYGKDEEDIKNVALVIEEINRGNAAAIFGDIFQLLDRNKNGTSEYSISNPTIEQYLNDKGGSYSSISLPANLYIFATMNTSDQNVFKLDTAFKRRWEFKRMTNASSKASNNLMVPTINVKWENFIAVINEKISNNEELSGDRQIGKWFVKGTITAEQFANKVLEYLYNDVYKYADRSEIFNTASYNNFDRIYDAFCTGKKDVFAYDVLELLSTFESNNVLEENSTSEKNDNDSKELSDETEELVAEDNPSNDSVDETSLED